MAHIRGSGQGALAGDDGVRLPFEIALTVEVAAGGRARALECKVVATGSEPVTADILRLAAKALDEFTDYVGARIVRKYQMHAQQWPGGQVVDDAGNLSVSDVQTDYSWADPSVILGPRFVEEAQAELQRRRRSRLSDEDYLQVARVYRAATAGGQPAQRAVADAMYVSIPRAAALISEARRRNLLPPARRGRSQQS